MGDLKKKDYDLISVVLDFKNNKRSPYIVVHFHSERNIKWLVLNGNTSGFFFISFLQLSRPGFDIRIKTY